MMLLRLEAERRIEAEALPESDKKLILQEIKIDTFSTIRRFVDLTPSMCPILNCGYDSARNYHLSSWDDAPLDQSMADGATFGDWLRRTLEHHKATKHTAREINAHIVSESELNKMSWTPGQHAHIEGALAS